MPTISTPLPGAGDIFGLAVNSPSRLDSYALIRPISRQIHKSTLKRPIPAIHQIHISGQENSGLNGGDRRIQRYQLWPDIAPIPRTQVGTCDAAISRNFNSDTICRARDAARIAMHPLAHLRHADVYQCSQLRNRQRIR